MTIRLIESLESRQLLSAAIHAVAGSPDNPDAMPAILIRYTYFGDPNLDGEVDASDYSPIDSGFQSHPQGWMYYDDDTGTWKDLAKPGQETSSQNLSAQQVPTLKLSASPQTNAAAPVINSSSLPSSTAPGNTVKASVHLTLTDKEYWIEKGFSVSIYASPAGEGSDADDQLITTVTRKNVIKPSHSVSVSIPVTSIPANIQPGSYNLTASTLDSSGAVAWYTSSSTLQIEPRNMSLDQTAAVISSKHSASGAVTSSTVALLIQNTGNVPISGLKHIAITAVDQSKKSNINIGTQAEKVNLQPGDVITLTFTVKKPSSSLNDPYMFNTAINDPVTGALGTALSTNAVQLFGTT